MSVTITINTTIIFHMNIDMAILQYHHMNIDMPILQGWFVAQTWYDSSSTIVFLVHQREVETIPTFLSQYHDYNAMHKEVEAIPTIKSPSTFL